MNLLEERDMDKRKYEYSVKQIANMLVDLQNGKLCENCIHEAESMDYQPCNECSFATHDKWEWRGFNAQSR